MSYPTVSEVANALVRTARLARTSAWYQDIDPDVPGNVFVFMKTDTGVLFRQSMPNHAVMAMLPGAAVKLGLDSSYNLVVLEPDFAGQRAQNLDPSINNPANPYFYANTSQETFKTFQVVAVGSDTVPALYVTVLQFFYYYQGQWYFLANTAVDLTSSIPAANTHLMALVYLTTSGTLAAAVSTAQNLGDALDDTDYNEAAATAVNLLAYGKFIRLYGGQSNITEADMRRDGRQMVNLQETTYAAAALATSTETTLFSLAVAELTAYRVTGDFIAAKSDYTAAIAGTFSANVRRATGGNVTLVGTPSVVYDEDSSGSPDFNIDVDTGTQTLRGRAVSIAAEDWNWKVRYDQLRLDA